MKLVDVPLSELSSQLRGPGVGLHVGPFRILYHVRVRQVASVFQTLYGHFPVIQPDSFFDTVISCLPALDPALPLRPTATCRIDGRFHTATRLFANSMPSLEWTANWAIATKAHWLVLIHAAVVASGDSAVIMPGGSGSGKSTLAAALAANGWRLLSDEFAMIDPATARIQPSPRPVSLKNESISVMRSRAPTRMLAREFTRTSKGTVGYLIPSARDVDHQITPAIPRMILFPRWEAGSPPTLTRLSQAETFIAMIRNSVNYDILGEAGAAVVAEIVRRCPAYTFTYGDLDVACGKVGELIGSGLDHAHLP